MAAYFPGTRPLRFSATLSMLAVLTAGGAGFASEDLFKSQRVKGAGGYTERIEGPAVDAAGALYAANFKEDGTIGRLKPDAAETEVFAKLPPKSFGSGIRFDRDGRMYVADFNKHNIFVFEPGRSEPDVYFHSDRFHQPNDLAIAADGTLYASDPARKNRTGQIWRITRGPDGKGRGEVMTSQRKMGVTNGIDLSPDGKTLYVSESMTREIWAYRIQGAKLVTLGLVKRFGKCGSKPECELDGLRTDVDGRIFVARILNGTVAVLRPDGHVVREVPLLGKAPTNLTFGGPDGRTVYVTQRQGCFIESFRTDRPGREPCLQMSGAAC